MKRYFQIKNSILGGAIGDALGYSVEFMSETEIFNKYGKDGIKELEIKNGVAEISDDTQMTLFTITGILEGITRGKMRGIMGTLESYCYSHYKDWYITQTKKYEDIISDKDFYRHSWLLNCKELYKRRAPGNTCLSALAKEKKFDEDAPINNSKGCGGVMRVAPIGLYLAGKATYTNIAKITIGNVRYTHGHPLAYIPAAYLTVLLAILINEENKTLEDAVNYAFSIMSSNFNEEKYFDEFRKLYNKVILLSKEKINDLDAIHELGQGWVAEETIAIALYCALKYKDDFIKAIEVAANHGGDSDSTASITGQIIGAMKKGELCDNRFYIKLELKDVIEELAKDLYQDCLIEEYSNYRDPIWESKYIYKDYFVNKN